MPAFTLRLEESSTNRGRPRACNRHTVRYHTAPPPVCRYSPTEKWRNSPASTGGFSFALADDEMAPILLGIQRFSLASGSVQLRLRG